MKVMITAVAIVACAVTMAGCGDSDVSPSEGRETRPADLTIPRVRDPLEVSKFANNPCALVGPAERAEIGLPDTVYDAEENSARCDLQVDGDKPDPVHYQRIVVMQDGGLRDAYAQCGVIKSLDCSQWTVGDVDGYPTIRANGEPEAKHGMCRLYLGIADDAQVAIIDVQFDPNADGPDCDRAEKSAAGVLAALR